MSQVESQLSRPFALKYRPQLFSQLVGNIFHVKVLQISILQQDIANAYFLSGTRGSGKTSLARIFAKAINCKHLTPEGEPCLKCDSCISIDNQTNVDVIEVDAASENSVENIRRLIESVHYAAVEAKFKVIILDECHSLTTQAANALLKTLESPPPNVVFVFCTTEPDKVIETIRSRCLVMRFKTISNAEIVGRLKFICSQEKIEFDEVALDFIARYVHGGLRDAVCFLDQLARHKSKLTMEFLHQALSLINENDIFDFIQLILNKNESSSLQKAIDLSFDKPILDFILAFIDALENIYLFKLGLLSGIEDKPIYKTFSSLLSRKDILSLIATSRSFLKESRFYYLLSQRALIIYFVLSLFECFVKPSQATLPIMGPILSMPDNLQQLSQVFADAQEVLEGDLVRFGLSNGSRQ